MKPRDEDFWTGVEKSFREGVRKAQRELFEKGLPIVYMKNGKIHYEYPPNKDKQTST